MALAIADRVWETAITNGTGDFTLAGAVPTFRTFQSVYATGSTNTFPYVIVNPSAGEWEIGTSYLNTGTTLKRAGSQTVVASTNAGAAVNFSAGTKDVIITAHSSWLQDLVHTNLVQAFSRQQYFGTATLTDATNIAWNVDVAQVAQVTLAGNRTLSAPTNLKAGATYVLFVKQDGAGSRTLAYDAVFKWPSGAAPTLSSVAGATDILTFISDGTNLYGVAQLAFS